MRFRYVPNILAFAILSSGLASADPAKVAPEPKVGVAIRFPEVTPAPSPPAPVPNPTAPITLNADELYVIDSDAEVMVGAYPSGIVSITSEAGPMTVKAKFAGGGGKLERKVFAGKFITTIEATGSGVVTLVVVPVGATKRSDWIEKSIAANVGPQPPPIVDPITDPFTLAIKTAYLSEVQLDRKDSVTKLAKLYRTASNTGDPYPWKTNDDLFKDMKAVSATLLQPTAIPAVRKVIGDRLNPNFGGTKSTDPINRVLVASELATVATALEGAVK